MRRTSCGRTGVGDPAIVRFAVVAGARVSQTTTGIGFRGGAGPHGQLGPIRHCFWTRCVGSYHAPNRKRAIGAKQGPREWIIGRICGGRGDHRND